MDLKKRNAENSTTFAYFVTPHGFGHAARASAVMNEIARALPGAHFQIYTRVPEWFFHDTLQCSYEYNDLLTDVGLVQATPLLEDMDATLRKLAEVYPLDQALVAHLANDLQGKDCCLVLCDVAPMGIAVAKKAGLPSILIENFTWDWIYEGYLDREPRLQQWVDYLRELFAQADAHIQTHPACDPQQVDLVSQVVSRAARMTPAELRAELDLPLDARLALITMGGIEQQYGFLDRLTQQRGIHYIIPAASPHKVVRENLILLPHHTPIFHPDLVQGSDVVIGKVGYSTMGEVYWAGISFAYVPRENFRESPKLVDFIRKEIPGFEIKDEQFMRGDWIERIPELMDQGRIKREGQNGATEIAQFVLERAKSITCA